MSSFSTKRVYVVALAYLCRYLANKQNNVSLDEVTADMLYNYTDSSAKAAGEKKEEEKEATSAVKKKNQTKKNSTTTTTKPPILD